MATGLEEARLRIRLLGRFEVWRNHSLISTKEWGRRKTQSLLKLLLTQRGQPFTTDQLLDALYPKGDPEKASINLRTRISQLRYVLEPGLSRGADSQYILHLSQGNYCFSDRAPCRLDCEEFQEHLEAAQELKDQERLHQALERYQQAIELYRGHFLAEDLYEDWAQVQRERYLQLFIEALEGLADCHARLGDFARAMEVCQRAIQEKPTHERAYRQLMLYSYHNGDSQGAAEAYRRCSQSLRERLHAEPSHEIQALHDRIQQGKIDPAQKIVPHNLPCSLTNFIGREQEFQQVKKLLRTTRLLTLTGTGGSGKTWLALKTAAQSLGDFQDGIWFVDLSLVSEPDSTLRAVATASGIKPVRELSLAQQVIDDLRPRHALLLLDNCEHLVEACAHLAEMLLHACPNLRILATSREKLGIPDEVAWLVPPLSMPKGLPSPERLLEYDAIRLFVEQARSVQPNFTVTEQNFSIVAQICRRLDGMPLAIKLTAARLNALSLEQIAFGLNDRFRLLAAGNRTALPRHQTLRAALDWSFNLLSDPERALLLRLSVFWDGWTLAAAEAICSGQSIPAHEVLTLATRLVEKSLVLFEDESGQARYRMLETTKAYAQEKLQESGEADTWRRSHRDFFLLLAKEAERGGQTPGAWLRQCESEYDNFWAALRWSLEREEKEEVLCLIGTLTRFWELHSRVIEGPRWRERLLGTSEGELIAPEPTRQH